MKVVFSIPTITGDISTECHQSLCAAYTVLRRAGVEYEENTISNCPYLPVARNTLVMMFMADPDATDLFFIDADVGFDAAGVVRILSRPEEIVAGIYPLKRDAIGYPVRIKTQDGIPIGRDGLIEAELLPTGFMRIKRCVFEKMFAAYPQLKYAESVVEVRGSGISEGYDLFHMEHDPEKGHYRTEDYAFCRRWTDIGGQVWVYPDIDFSHVGRKRYQGNYHAYLLQQPGGRYEHIRLDGTMEIPGWLSFGEAAWLAERAQTRKQIVEMGSAWGRSTRAMADNTMNPDGTIYAVDDWHGPRDVRLSAEERQNLYERFCLNLQEHIHSGHVVPIRADHGMLSAVSHLRPDMVFLDGDHSADAVKRDIQFWLPRLIPGGLLCGHDADWESVREALKEALPTYQPVPGTALWYWESPR